MKRGLLALAVTLLTLELGAAFLLRGAPPARPASALPDQALRPDERRIPEGLRPYVLHPYVGFVRDPGRTRHELNGSVIDVPVNALGFFGPAPGPEQPGEFVVAVTGGSVATELFLRAGDRLAAGIAELPPAEGKEVRLVSLALGGFKQPQQLAALGWVLGLGFHVDAVVNVDGFNEVVLPWAENRRQRTAPAYPRMWRAYAARSVDPEVAVLYGRASEIRDAIAASQASESRFPTSVSRFLRLLERHAQRRLGAEQAALEESLRERLGARRATYQETGPPHEYGDAMFAEFAAHWRRTSLQLWRLAEGNGIDYFHFLQPNQYVPGSKRFTEDELRDAVGEPGSAYREGAEAGYPHLLEEAARLQDAGAPFRDLTGLFEDEPGSAYRDRCCHLTALGNERLADAVVAAMADRYAAEETSR